MTSRAQAGRAAFPFRVLLVLALLFLSMPWQARAQLDVHEIDYEKVFAEGFSRGGTVLNLSGKKIGDEGLKRLLQKKDRLRKVKKLDLRYCELTEAAGKMLAQTDAFPALKALEIRHNFLMDAGTSALAGASGLGGLEKLGLGWNEVRDAGALALADSKRFPKLKKLDLRGNYFADKTKEALGKSFAGLRDLKLTSSL